jgi:hypothetical protein
MLHPWMKAILYMATTVVQGERRENGEQNERLLPNCLASGGRFVSSAPCGPRDTRLLRPSQSLTSNPPEATQAGSAKPLWGRPSRGGHEK